MFYETGPREKDKYLYPPAVQALGWFFELSPTVLTLVYPAWVLYRWVSTSGELISYILWRAMWVKCNVRGCEG